MEIIIDKSCGTSASECATAAARVDDFDERRGGRLGWRRCNFPRPHWREPLYCRVFREGRAGPLASRAGKSLFARLSLARSSHGNDVYDLSARLPLASICSNKHCIRYPNEKTARSENSELVAGTIWKQVGEQVVGAGSTMLPALPLLVLLALAPARPALARRHAPDLREDEPARRTTRPAGMSRRLL